MPLIKSGSKKAILTEKEASYIAGFFDGEGCVNFANSRSGSYIRILIVNTNLEVLEYIQSLFGGDISKTSRKDGWKQSWQLRISWSKAIEFLEAIEPYVRIKEDQIHLAFCWDALRPGRGKISDEKRREHRDITKYMKECLTYFNKRGIHDLEDPVERVLGEMHASH